MYLLVVMAAMLTSLVLAVISFITAAVSFIWIASTIPPQSGDWFRLQYRMYLVIFGKHRIDVLSEPRRIFLIAISCFGCFSLLFAVCGIGLRLMT